MKHPYLVKLRFLLLVLLSLSTALGAWAQANIGSISGRVTDAKNEGLPGVTVLVEGTSIGGSTNADGTFMITSVPAGPQTLVISFVGYATARQPVTVLAGRTTTVPAQKLSENATALGEAVVVGYGTQRRQDVTGSVTAITAKDFVKGQITSPEQLVQGKVAGVQITTSGGAPGAAATIRIRGGSSLNASNDPLIVIDGVPVDNPPTTGVGALAGVANPLSLINPNDIETFTVLKDASATAIYGSRASNGVILITTKKGLSGEKITVNVNSQTTLSRRYNSVPVLSADEFRATVQRVVPGKANLLGSANTNWQDELFRNAMTYDNNISLTGSIGKAVPFRVSYGNLNQQGILITNRLIRNSASLSLTPILLDDHLRVTMNVKGSVTDNNFAESNTIGAAVAFDPTQPVYNGNSTYGGFFQYTQDPANPNSDANQQGPKNPVATLMQTRDRSTVLRSIGNIQLDYKFHFLPDLHANVNVGYDVLRSSGTNSQSVLLANDFFNRPLDPAVTGYRGGSFTLYQQNRTNKLLEAYLNYTKQLGGTRLELLGGYSYQDFLTNAPNFPSYLGQDGNLDANGQSQLIVRSAAPPFPYRTQYTIISFYGRANLNIKDRYLLTGTLRNDISSRFNPDNRSALFPAGSFAWRLKGEDFLKDNTTFSDLKLRVGYGLTGQQDVFGVGGDYPYILRYALNANSNQYLFGGVPYAPYSPQPFNNNLRWEKTATYNAGLDYGFLNGRLTGSVDVYYRKTTDLLNNTYLSAGTNYSNYYIYNVGSLENRGVELNLNASLVRSENFSWDVNANATYNKNKILSLGPQEAGFVGIPNNGIGGGTGTNIGLFAVGQPSSAFYVFKQVYDANGKPLNDVYADLNGDGKITPDDRYLYKQSAPPVILGFSSTMNYRKLSLAFTLRSNLGNYVYNNIESQNGTYQNLTVNSSYLGNLTQDANFTQFPNTTTNRYSSDYYIQNASFLRMQNATLGYNVGKVFSNRGNLNLTLAVQNVFLITKYKGLDPELPNGVDNNTYPRPRAYTFGLNLNI
jgi:iron complex outermembrane receptor protein